LVSVEELVEVLEVELVEVLEVELVEEPMRPG
jgi:hypothetical protein